MLRALAVLACPCLWSAAAAQAARAAPPLRDAPVVWYEDDRQHVAMPAKRSPNLVWDDPLQVVVRPLGRATDPVRAVRKAGVLFGGDHVPPASNLNALDEVPNSSWFTNRIGLFPMSPGEVARGAGEGTGPDRSAPWTVVSAKTEGVTLGFNLRDARGETYVIKFDPRGFLGTSTAASAISARLLHAAGYNTSDDGPLRFQRDDLVVGEGVQVPDADGGRRAMTEADLDAILARVDRPADGGWLAVYSKFVAGKPVGPFDYYGRRADDPNDRIDHEHRRELRGLKLFCSWLNHFDTKQHNTLDVYVQQGGRGFLRHHLIDFSATLGTGGYGPIRRHGYEFTIDPLAVFGRTLAVGLHESTWRKLQRPTGLNEVGYFESELYDPLEFKPLAPNAAFANMTDRDGYWAAKIITAFTDEHLRAVCERAGFRDPAAAAYVARVLGERRDKIGRVYFDRVPPLDFFVCRRDSVTFHDLGVERGLYAAAAVRYRVRVAAVTAERQRRAQGEWAELRDAGGGSDGLAVDLSADAHARAQQVAPAQAPFVAVECQVDRGGGWSASTTAFIARASRRVVAIER